MDIEQFRRAEAFFNEKKYEDALARLLPLAEEGYAPAQYYTAKCYLFAHGVPRDLKTGRAWLGRAAEQGHPAAQSLLGLLTLDGIGGEPSAKAANEWFERAAVQGYAAAQRYLANSYREGRGTRKNLRRAIMWYDRAAENGSEEARESADFLRGILAENASFRRDLPLAEAGDVGAMKRVANAYEWGFGVKKNVKRFKAWTLRAAEAGDSEAMYRAGWNFLDGNDKTAALLWFEKAAAQGYEDAAKMAEHLKSRMTLPE